MNSVTGVQVLITIVLFFRTLLNMVLGKRAYIAAADGFEIACNL